MNSKAYNDANYLNNPKKNYIEYFLELEKNTN